MGPGQPNRVDSALLACERAEDACERMGWEKGGFACASDAFFPFRDNVDVLAAHGVTCIIQPADPSATMRASRPATSTALRWCSPAPATSATSRLPQVPDLAPHSVGHRTRGVLPPSFGAISGTWESLVGAPRHAASGLNHRAPHARRAPSSFAPIWRTSARLGVGWAALALDRRSSPAGEGRLFLSFGRVGYHGSA